MTKTKTNEKEIQYLKEKIDLQNKIIKENKKANSRLIKLIIFVILILILIPLIFFHYMGKNITNQEKLVKKYMEQNMEYRESLEKFKPIYLFLGDSLTEHYDIFSAFPTYRIINSGHGGDETTDILRDLYMRVYRFHPTDIFLQVGTNDINLKKNPEDVYHNIVKITEEILKELPNTKIYIESIYPSRESFSENDRNNLREEVNKLLKEYCMKHKITYIDMYSLLKDENENKIKEEYVTDGLHLNEKGYSVISNQLKKYMK